MPRARYTAEGGTYRVDGHSFEPGDEIEVDHELADYLTDLEDFEVIVEKADGTPDQGDEPPDETADVDEAESADGEESGADGGTETEFDVGEFLDRTPVDDVADDIKAGEADGHLDELLEEASRVTVQDAIGERRAELEE